MNVNFFEKFVSIPCVVKMSGQSITMTRLSKRKLIYWFLVAIILQLFIGVHMSAYVFYTLTNFKTLSNLQAQRISVCMVLGTILSLSLFLNLFFHTHFHDCEFLIREGLRIDVSLESKLTSYKISQTLILFEKISSNFIGCSRCRTILISKYPFKNYEGNYEQNNINQ